MLRNLELAEIHLYSDFFQPKCSFGFADSSPFPVPDSTLSVGFASPDTAHTCLARRNSAVSWRAPRRPTVPRRPFLCFFERRGEGKKSHSQSPTRATLITPQPCVVKIALNLVRGRHLAIDPMPSPQTEKGRRKRTCSCARHYGAPSEPPRWLHASLHQNWLRPHFRLCQ